MMRTLIVSRLRKVRDYLRIRLSGTFDREFYLFENPHIATARGDPLWHYINYGEKTAREPVPWFDSRIYRLENRGKLNDSENVFAHYLRCGQTSSNIPKNSTLPPPGNFDEPVDILIPWAGTDHSHISGDCNNDVRRARYNGELPYCIKSIIENAPWYNKVFVLLDESEHLYQVLSRHFCEQNRIIAVERRKYFKQGNHPTNNICSIQTIIHKVETLSEHFILIEDDMMLTRRTEKSQWFTDEGQPYILFIDSAVNRRPCFKCESLEHRVYVDETVFEGDSPPTFGPYGHLPVPLKKSICRDVALTYQEWLAFVQSHKFRFSSDGNPESVWELEEELCGVWTCELANRGEGELWLLDPSSNSVLIEYPWFTEKDRLAEIVYSRKTLFVNFNDEYADDPKAIEEWLSMFDTLFPASETEKPGYLAMAMCVRNEDRFLLENLCFHRASGVERAYVFLDRCDDQSALIASQFDWVHAIRIRPDYLENLKFVSDLHVACMERALQLARQEGYQWLLFLDADEFAIGEDHQGEELLPKDHDGRQGNLAGMLKSLSPRIEMVQLATHELVPISTGDTSFLEQRYFQSSEGLCTEIFDPVEEKTLNWQHFIGHSIGKSIVRTSADVQAYDSHLWVQRQSCEYSQMPSLLLPETIQIGYHLHYVVVSNDHWREKFGKLSHEPEHWQGGEPVEPPKEFWKNACRKLPRESLADYFEIWIGRSRSEMEALLASGLIYENSIVAQVLSESSEYLALRNQPFHQSIGKVSEWTPPIRYLFPDSFEEKPVTQLIYQIGTLKYESLRGFYHPETYYERSFRWAKPIAEVRLLLPKNDYSLIIDFGPLKKICEGNPNVFIGGHRLPEVSSTESLEEGLVTFEVRKKHFRRGEREHWLRIDSQAIDTSSISPEETRILGAPVFRLEFIPNGSEERERGIMWLVHAVRKIDIQQFYTNLLVKDTR